MRKFLIRLGVVLCVGLLFSSVGAQEGDGNTYGLVSVNNADVRVGPDFAYGSVGRLPRNASVQVMGRAGDFFRSWDGRQWLEIEYSGGRGWIYARLLRTSTPFNSIPPTGRMLPRDNNGRVPEVFDLSSNVCDQWQGTFSQSASDFSGGDEIVVNFPTLQGANVYSVITVSPSGERDAFDSETGTATILLRRLPEEEGEYQWRVAPYWTNSDSRFRWQQVCLLQTGGTFTKEFTGRIDTRPTFK